MPGFVTAGLLLAAILLVLVIQHQKRLKRSLEARAAIFDEVRRHCADATIRIAPDGYPILAGLFEDTELELRLVPDTLTVRRLPQLWLIASFRFATGHAESFGALVRAAGTEFYAYTPTLPHGAFDMSGFDVDTILRASSPAADWQRVESELRSALADQHIKEIVVTPIGVRIVRQMAEGERGAHLILRHADFGAARLELADLAAVKAVAQSFRHLPELRASSLREAA
jgi:hypothetical protein